MTTRKRGGRLTPFQAERELEQTTALIKRLNNDLFGVHARRDAAKEKLWAALPTAKLLSPAYEGPKQEMAEADAEILSIRRRIAGAERRGRELRTYLSPPKLGVAIEADPVPEEPSTR